MFFNSNYKRTTSISLALVLLGVTLALSGCNLFSSEATKLKSAFMGIDAVYTSYDDNSSITDRIHSNAMHISADDTFAKTNSEGVTEASGVLNVTIGKESMIHVGSSAIIADSSLVNVFEEYAKTVDLSVIDNRGVPFLNKMFNKVGNLFNGKKYIIFIRSQTGKPLATYVGDSVSYFKTPVDKSTGFIVDNKYLFAYRVNYTVIPVSFLKDNQ